jgi:hypothetical protein
MKAAGLDEKHCWPSYAFSFNILTKEKHEQVPDIVIKLLLEPSVAGVDDLIERPDQLSPDNIRAYLELADTSIELPEDVDLQLGCSLYASWANLVAIIPDNERVLDETYSVLTGLEARTQMIWNKCYTSAQLIDDVISKDQTYRDFERMYLNFSRSFDDARSVLSSAISSRAQRMLDAIVSTSRLQSEIDALALKLSLMEKHLERKERKREHRYNVIIESMLFLIASTAILDMFVGFPVMELTKTGKDLFLSVFFVCSVFVIPAILFNRLR